MRQGKYINIDPAELSKALSREVFGKFAVTGELYGANEYGVHVFYGREGSDKQGHILFTFVTKDSMKVQIDFNVTEYVADTEGYLNKVVEDMIDMMQQWKADQSPLIVAGASEQAWTPTALADAVAQEIN